jgi:hypothetical protein
MMTAQHSADETGLGKSTSVYQEESTLWRVGSLVMKPPRPKLL